jgi:hypothetical protein
MGMTGNYACVQMRVKKKNHSAKTVLQPKNRWSNTGPVPQIGCHLDNQGQILPAWNNQG